MNRLQTPDRRRTLVQLALLLALAVLPGRAAAADASWTLLAVGDTMLAGSGAPEFARFGYARSFATLATDFAAADLVYANLEAPVATVGEPVAGKTYTFRQPAAVTAALAAAGIDVVHLANNHILDYGPAALDETIARLRAAGLGHCGAGVDAAAARQPAAWTTPGGVRFEFLCYSNTFPEDYHATSTRPGTAFGHEAWVRNDVAAAVARADVVVAAFHWGAELMTEPKDYQRALAAAALEAGAAIVLGHHPHVLQPVEFRDGRVVAYSLGNFVFGSYSQNVRDSVVLRIRGRGAAVTEVSALPINVYNPEVVFRPVPLGPAAAAPLAATLFGGPVRAQGAWWGPAPADPVGELLTGAAP